MRYAADAGMTFSSLVIIDLGIAHVWRDGADADTVKFGTRPYAPPEQYGFGQTSVRSDIDALGALLFFCLLLLFQLPYLLFQPPAPAVKTALLVFKTGQFPAQ